MIAAWNCTLNLSVAGEGIMYRLLVWSITLGVIYAFSLYVVLPSKGYRRVTKSPSVERTFQLDDPIILDYFTSEQQCKEWQTYRDKNGALHIRCTDDAYGRGRGGKG